MNNFKITIKTEHPDTRFQLRPARTDIAVRRHPEDGSEHKMTKSGHIARFSRANPCLNAQIIHI